MERKWVWTGKPWQAFKTFAIIFSFIMNFVLLLVLLSMNAIAILLRNRFQNRQGE